MDKYLDFCTEKMVTVDNTEMKAQNLDTKVQNLDTKTQNLDTTSIQTLHSKVGAMDSSMKNLDTRMQAWRQVTTVLVKFGDNKLDVHCQPTNYVPSAGLRKRQLDLRDNPSKSARE